MAITAAPMPMPAFAPTESVLAGPVVGLDEVELDVAVEDVDADVSDMFLGIIKLCLT